DLGLIGVELTGGEPFLYSHLKDLVEFCTKNLKSVGILTNGTILNDEWINYFVKVKEKTGTDILFAISLDASSPETFSKITGSNKFHHVINSIKSLSSKGFKVRVGTVISPYNFKELEEIVKLSIENGAYKITWSSVLPFGKGKELAWTNDVQFFKEAQKIERDVYNKYKNFIAYFEQDLWDQINTLVNCGIGHKNVVVSPNGYIRPCLLLPENKILLGDLKKKKIIEIFSNPLLKIFAEISPPDFKTCKNCNFKYYCRGCVLRPLSIMEKFPNKDCNWIRENGKIKEILSMKND
ncbi:MAG: radical SAM protein, partial [Candidatus Pacearchaeota archaeon]